ncbi:MAG: type II secretion system protein [Candidatus Manganitrophus sp.]|nr:type II secretion system protein [Candidatus Manganitrophus sp.]
MTLLELIVTAVIILLLASAAMPLSKMGERRAKEMELRQALRDLRLAIDRFKDDWDSKRISHSESDIANEETGYPRSLGVLVEGVPVPDPNDKKIRKYLRRIPIDPFTRSTEWGTRCYEDEPDSMISCDRDVYDVYSRSDQLGIDGTKVQTW